MNSLAEGTFEVTMTPEPVGDVVDGVSLGRLQLTKKFEGALTATSTATMLAARTSLPGSAGYVAIERVTGTLLQKKGTFVLQHSGIMTRGAKSLSVTVVPDSGTGELAGLAGTMEIDIVDGKHFYKFSFRFE